MRNSEAPDEPPKLTTDTIESYALSAFALRNFFAGLPDREVVVRFPYSSMNISFSSVTSWLDGLGDDQFIWDWTSWYVVAKAEKTDGWLCLTFNWRYWIYFNLHAAEMAKYRNEHFVSQIDATFGRAYSRYEAGISRESLRDIIPDLLYARDAFLRHYPANYGIANLVEDPIALIQQSLTLWDQNPGYLDLKFYGGGFGLWGGIQGMSNAYLINSLIDSHNSKLSTKVSEQVSLPLSYGFHQLRATQSLLAGKLLFADDTIRPIRHGTGEDG